MDGLGLLASNLRDPVVSSTLVQRLQAQAHIAPRLLQAHTTLCGPWGLSQTWAFMPVRQALLTETSQQPTYF